MQIKKLLIATSNFGKARELAASLADFPLEIVTLADLPVQSENIAEDGQTFQENAELKAKFWCEKSSLSTLADDSGIQVTALRAELGIMTHRFGAGELVSDEEWLNYFLKRMKSVKDRQAEFTCVLAFALSLKIPSPSPSHQGRVTDIVFFEGKVTGEITREIKAPIKSGIPLSSVFRPTGSEKVFAAMNEAEKEHFSHRGLALAKFKEFLSKMYL